MLCGKSCPGDTVLRLNQWTSCRPLHLLLICIVGLACYSTSLSVPFVFDDFDAIVLNPDVIGGKPLLQLLLHGSSRRIADISFALNYRLHGQELPGYHLTNLAIHLCTTMLVYLLCLQLPAILRSQYPNSHAPQENKNGFMPLAVALLFVSHPIQTQAVTYLVQRHTSLATLLYLAALCLYLSGRQRYADSGWQGAVLLRGGLFLCATVAACFTKQIAYSLPVMILLCEVLLFRGRLLRLYLSIAGIGVAALLAVLVIPLVQGGVVADALFTVRHATAETLYTPRSSYMLTQLQVVATYLRLLLLPIKQNLDYDYQRYVSPQQLAVFASAALHAALLGMAFFMLRWAKSKGEPHCTYLRLAAFGICWFYVGLLIESSIIPIADVIMEHRLYLPSVGFIISVVAGVELLGEKCTHIQRSRWLLLIMVCLTFSTATVLRNRLWSNDVAFWEDAARKSPQKGRVLGNLAYAYLTVGRYEEALRANVAALRKNPSMERAWISLGAALEGIPSLQGRFTTGQQYLTAQNQVDFRWLREYNSVTFNNMAVSCEYLNSPDEAFKWYVQSVQMNENFALAWLNLGMLAKKTGNRVGLERSLAKLVILDPSLARRLSGS